MSGPRICPNCGLLVSADMSACQCGYVFGSLAHTSTAAARLRDTVDLFSAKEALAIAFQAVSELKGGIVRWMAVIGLFQVLPMAITSGSQTLAGQLAFAAAVPLSLYVSCSLQRAALAHLRGDVVVMSRSMLSLPTFGAILLVYIVMAAPVFIGTLLFIAPGIYLMLTWSQCGFLIMDGRARNVDALRASEQLTRDRRLELLVVIAVPILMSLMSAPLVSRGGLGGSLLTPKFVFFLVGTVWQTVAATFGAFAGAAAYQMLLNSRKNTP